MPRLLPMLTIARTTLVSALLLAAASCGEPTAVPARFTATYVLVRANDFPLPTLVGQSYLLVADTLRFQTDGQVRRTTVVRRAGVGGISGDSTEAWSSLLPYQVSGRGLIIGYTTPCSPNANCIGNEKGTIDEESVSLIGTFYWPGEPRFHFRRL